MSLLPAFSRPLRWFAPALLLALPAAAAINPANFQQVASDRLKLKETARIVHTFDQGGDRLQRVTLVAVVLEELRASRPRVGSTIVIDYTVNLTQRDQAARRHRASQGNMPGPQFMAEPEPPTLDAEGTFWAHLAPLGGRLGNVNRHAGAVAGIGDYAATGQVFVPAAGQYSFDPPM